MGESAGSSSVRSLLTCKLRTGGTGYIGGTVLDTLVSKHPEYKITVLLRRVPESFSKRYPKVNITLLHIVYTRYIRIAHARPCLCAGADAVQRLSECSPGLFGSEMDAVVYSTSLLLQLLALCLFKLVN